MRWSVVRTILFKEVQETLRDRRTLFAMLVLPILFYPLFFLAMGRIAASERAERRTVKPTIALWGPLPAEAVRTLEKELEVEIRERRPAAPAAVAREAGELIAKNRVQVVIATAADAETRLAGDDSATVDLYFDRVTARSDAARERVVRALETLSDRVRDQRLVRHRLPPRFDHPLHLREHDVASKARRGGDIAGRLLPFVLIMVMAICGLIPAVDLTAGEKERGTLQTLLCAPVTAVEIVAGKYLTVVLISLACVAANLAAMGLAVSSQMAALGEGALEFELGLATYLGVFAAMIPVALLLSGLLLALSVFARSFREANAYLSPLILALTFPMLIAAMPGVELNAKTAVAPIVNLALVARDLLRGRVDVLFYTIALLANFVYAAMAVVFASRVFEAEQVLLGGERPWRDVFGSRQRAERTPSPRNVVLFVAVLFVFLYYGALALAATGLGPARAMAAMQIGLLLVPTLAWVGGHRFHLRDTLMLSRPTLRATAGGLCLAAGAWAIGHLIFLAEQRLFPGAREYGELLAKTFGELPSDLPTMLFVFALLPAITEELCFRGVVLSGFANTGSKVVAVVGSALAFGLFHLNPYHIIAAAGLGLLFAYAALESRTIFVSMLAHFVNNGIAMVATKVPGMEQAIERPPVVAAALLVAGLGLWLLRGSRRPDAPQAGSAVSAPSAGGAG